MSIIRLKKAAIVLGILKSVIAFVILTKSDNQYKKNEFRRF